MITKLILIQSSSKIFHLCSLYYIVPSFTYIFVSTNEAIKPSLKRKAILKPKINKRFAAQKDNEKHLERISNGKMIGGVVNGLAEYFDIDVTLLRVLFVGLFFVPFPIVFSYIILWVVMPNKIEKSLTI